MVEPTDAELKEFAELHNIRTLEDVDGTLLFNADDFLKHLETSNDPKVQEFVRWAREDLIPRFGNKHIQSQSNSTSKVSSMKPAHKRFMDGAEVLKALEQFSSCKLHKIAQAIKEIRDSSTSNKFSN